MKKLLLLGLIVVLGAGYMFGLPWWRAEQAYKEAESYIAAQLAAGKNSVKLSQFPELRKIPDNIRLIKDLNSLYADNTNVSNISAISGATDLKYITFRGSKIKDLSVIASLSSLQNIDLGETPVRDLLPLVHCRSLQRLDISKTHTLSLEPVTRIASLNWLNLYMGMSDDGSQVSYDKLVARGDIDIQPGNRFAQNYIP